MNSDRPLGLAVVRESIRAQQKRVREVYGKEIADLKKERDRQLQGFKELLTTIEKSEGRSQSRPPRKMRHPKSRRPAATTPAAVRERCEAVLRFLIGQKEPVGRGAICSSLKLSEHTVSTALGILCQRGKVRRLGTGRGTRYEAVVDSMADPAPSPSSQAGTLPGRILAILEERTWASAEELSQATGVPLAEVLTACDALAREVEIYATQREGRTVYVLNGAS